MKLRRVPIEKIKVPGTRVTAVYDEDTQELLKKTVDKLGILQPVIVVKIGEEFELVDGLHRLQEAREHSEVAIDAVVYEGTDADALMLNLVLNRVRGKTKASEMVQVIGALWTEYGKGIEEIETQTGLSRDYIERLIKISQGAPSVLEALDLEIIGVGHAEQLVRLPTFIQQEEVVAKQNIWRWKVTDLKDVVDQTLQMMAEYKEEPVVETPRPAATYHCEGCNKEAGMRDLRPVLLCPGCHGIVWRAAHATTPPIITEAPAETEAGSS